MLLVCNHTHVLDTAAVMLMTRRKVHFMCKKELFDHKIIGWALKLAGSFPVDRENGGAAGFMKAMRVLKAGEVLCVFPEGTRNKTREKPLLPLHQGVAMLGLMSKVPVVPLWVNGHFNPIHRCRMLAGKAVDVSAYKDVRKPSPEELTGFTREIENALLLTAKNMENP